MTLTLYAGFSPAYPMKGEAFRLKKKLILKILKILKPLKDCFGGVAERLKAQVC
jgi:hypothetical protein